jgi:tRNA nucleotidyltransferase/poly(A) polymerase
MLRAVRFAHQLRLVVEPATVGQIRARAGRASEPAGERTFAELRQLLLAPEARRGVRLLDELGLLATVLPELDACRGIEQSSYHHLDVFEHTLAVLDNAEDLLAEPQFYLGNSSPLPLDDDDRVLLLLAALAHDLGKPAVHRVDPGSGRVSFLGHDVTGMDVVTQMCARWCTSARLRDALRLLVRTHLHLGMLLHGPQGDRERYRFVRAVQPWPVHAVLLSVADRLATAGREDRRRWVRSHMLLARHVWEDIRAEHVNGLPEPLLDGMAIAEAAGIEPGPDLGKLVAALAEEQAVGAVATVEAAKDFVRGAVAGLE